MVMHWLVHTVLIVSVIATVIGGGNKVGSGLRFFKICDDTMRKNLLLMNWKKLVSLRSIPKWRIITESMKNILTRSQTRLRFGSRPKIIKIILKYLKRQSVTGLFLKYNSGFIIHKFVFLMRNIQRNCFRNNSFFTLQSQSQQWGASASVVKQIYVVPYWKE